MTGHCHHCNAVVHVYQATRAGPNHVLHLLLTMFLCGAWAPVWIVIALSDSGKRNTFRCGACHRTMWEV